MRVFLMMLLLSLAMAGCSYQAPQQESANEVQQAPIKHEKPEGPYLKIVESKLDPVYEPVKAIKIKIETTEPDDKDAEILLKITRPHPRGYETCYLYSVLEGGQHRTIKKLKEGETFLFGKHLIRDCIPSDSKIKQHWAEIIIVTSHEDTLRNTVRVPIEYKSESG